MRINGGQSGSFIKIILTELYFSILDNFVLMNSSYLHVIGSGTAFFFGVVWQTRFFRRSFENDFMTLELARGNVQNV